MSYFTHIHFAQPFFLLALLLLPLLYYIQYRRNRNDEDHLSVPGVETLGHFPLSLKVILRRQLPLLRLLAYGCLVVALARPQDAYSVQKMNGDGIDIMLCTDLSKSMEKTDFAPNRLEASRRVALDFVDHRPGDRIGLVVFSGESFTLCPLTYDHQVLKNTISSGLDDVLEDGTAIGMGLATAVDRLRTSTAKSKVIILLTDGANNSGKIDPVSAAEIAARYHIKVYTIGMAGLGNVKLPYPAIADSEIDEDLLKKIADLTHGRYFRAIDNNKLIAIYEEIDKLEKTTTASNVYTEKTEEFYPWALAALAMLGIEFVLMQTYLKSLT